MNKISGLIQAEDNRTIYKKILRYLGEEDNIMAFRMKDKLIDNLIKMNKKVKEEVEIEEHFNLITNNQEEDKNPIEAIIKIMFKKVDKEIEMEEDLNGVIIRLKE